MRQRSPDPSTDTYAVVALVFNPELEVLSVSRPDDVTDLGLPGGKVEPDDLSVEHAMVRELEEETGLVATHARRCYEGLERGRLVVTYLVSGYTGRLRSSHEGRTRWVPIAEFMQGTRSYRAYHVELFRHMGMIQ